MTSFMLSPYALCSRRQTLAAQRGFGSEAADMFSPVAAESSAMAAGTVEMQEGGRKAPHSSGVPGAEFD
jgi:hypothetical protein